ncbi:MAG: ATP-binding protein [Bacteroidetes bacterium]|nr:ATP-binding protein [Bacteroidota bacterium]
MTDVHELTIREPVVDPVDANAACIAREIGWFSQVVNRRLASHESSVHTNGHESTAKQWLTHKTHSSNGSASHVSTEAPPSVSSVPFTMPEPPDLRGDQSVYAQLVQYYEFTPTERIILMLAIIPHVQPHLLDVFLSVNTATGRGYSEFGGLKGVRHGGFLPTIETALFIATGNDLSERFRMHRLFEPSHVFSAHSILSFDTAGSSEPSFSSGIALSEEYVDFFTTGNVRKPQFSMEFPAKQLTTAYEWSDLIVDEYTMRQLEQIRTWLEHGRTLYEDWGMHTKLSPGFKALFFGPPGTGKTLTAALLGKYFQLDVYRIDLSMVVSKYIGETEKNLEKVFRKAENKRWILFFDEADALFGARTAISDSHDKYANQEIAYLLQRLEDYPGLVILASNMRNNVDEAFTRRLQAVINFPKPQFNERVRLWQNAFSPLSQPPGPEEIRRIGQQYEISGGAIMNVARFASLEALKRSEVTITVDDIIEGIKNEYRKEGKIA